ncbi:MAG TPA: hypothetical protein VGK19_23015 [Capsulimonadaceae bacterium]|jgi:hypothetical protein
MLFSRKPKPIIVRLVEFTTGQLIGKVNVAPDELPETFETTRSFHFGDADWQVLQATPMLAADYRKKGDVDLIVRMKPTGDEGRPYLEPTIASALPAATPGSSKAGVRRYQMLPEDWRQVELVSLSLQPAIDESVAAIRAIVDGLGEDAEGFTERRVRVGLESAFDPATRITLDEILALFPDGVDQQDGLAFLGEPGLIDGGFAFVSSSLTQYYGLVQDGIVAAFCIGGVGTHEHDSPEVQELADFAYDKGLTLIDWGSASQRNPDTEEFFQFFDTSIEMDDSAPV